VLLYTTAHVSRNGKSAVADVAGAFNCFYALAFQFFVFCFGFKAFFSQDFASPTASVSELMGTFSDQSFRILVSHDADARF